MEIHMPGPLANPKYLKRTIKLYTQMRKLNDGGWRLYNTTTNLRYLKSIDPSMNKRKIKMSQLQGQDSVILWEVSFVNFDVTGTCESFLL